MLMVTMEVMVEATFTANSRDCDFIIGGRITRKSIGGDDDCIGVGGSNDITSKNNELILIKLQSQKFQT